MERNVKNKTGIFFVCGVGLLAAFALWTIALSCIDVQPIGPDGSSVGFAAMNDAVHGMTGVSMTLYHLTDWLGLVPVAFAAGFAVLGFVQLVRRRSLWKVDASVLLLGGCYIAVMAAYLYFEMYPVNFRPVLIDGRLEASYPSSTTLACLVIMPTAMMQLHGRISSRKLRRVVMTGMAAFTALTVLGRVLSGVHWASDIIGGMLLSGGLVLLYAGAVRLTRKNMIP